MRVTSELYGDWDKFERILQALQRNNRDYQRIIRHAGDLIADKIVELIDSQAIELEPLVEEYRQRKIKEGYGDKILIRNSDFLSSIEVTDISIEGNDIQVFIGVRDGKTETGISMKELASYIEEGTSKQPARQPFKKSWENMRQEVKYLVGQSILDIIKEDLK